MIYKFEKEDEGKLVSEINVTVPLTYRQLVIHNKDQDPHDIHLEKGGLDLFNSPFSFMKIAFYRY